MEVSFLTPLAALAGLAVALPLAASLLSERRAGRLRGRLGLRPPGRRSRLPFLLAVVCVFSLLTAAAAQPVVRVEKPVLARTDAEVFFVFDVSRSMLASHARGTPTRFDRAVALGLELRQRLADVGVGVASMTDRPLPHLFPTADRESFAAVVRRALGIERPPPFEGRLARATDFQSLSALGNENYFSVRSVRRLAVVLSDGESRPFDPDGLARALDESDVGLLVVRFWDPEERIYRDDGGIEAGYRPDRGSDDTLARLAALSAGGRVFADGDVTGIAQSARAYLGKGPTIVTGESERLVPLAAYVVLAAAVPLAFLLVRRA